MSSPADEKGLRTSKEHHCNELTNLAQKLRYASAHGQTSIDDSAEVSEYTFRNLFMDNCLGDKLLNLLPQSLHAYENGAPAIGEARHAALQFILAATPDEKLQKEIVERYESFAGDISSSFENDLSYPPTERMELLHGVPDTVNPVKARLAYVQVPNGEKTELSLVWKVCLPVTVMID